MTDEVYGPVVLDPSQGQPSVRVTFGQAYSGQANLIWWNSEGSQSRPIPDPTPDIDDPLPVDQPPVADLKNGDFLQINFAVASIIDPPSVPRFRVTIEVYQNGRIVGAENHGGDLPTNESTHVDRIYLKFG